MRTRLWAFCWVGTLLATRAWAQVPLGPEFQVNTYTTNFQWESAIASDSAGNFVVTWSGSNGIDFDAFARRFSPSGTPLGSGEFRVNTFTTDLQTFPSVASDAAGDLVVVWPSYTQDGSKYGVFGRRFKSDGTPGPEFRVNTYTTNSQNYPTVAMDGSGNFVVVWQSAFQDGTSEGLFAQRYDAAGVAQGAEFAVNTYTTGAQAYPFVSMNATGDFVVVWSDGARDGSGRGVFGRRFNAAGVPQGSFRANAYTTGNQDSPSVAVSGDGGFLVAWKSNGQNGTAGVFARKYDPSGAPGPEFQVNQYTTGGQAVPRVSASADGRFVVVWESAQQDGSQYGIFARALDATGSPEGDEFQVNTYTTGKQRLPAVTSQLDGRFVVAWNSNGQDGSGYGVFAREFARDLIFRDGFESADLSAWSSSSTGGGDLVPSVLAAMRLTSVGLKGTVNDTASLFVEDDSPLDEDRYRARFYFDTNSYDPGETGGARRTRLFIVFEEAPTRRLAAIVLKRLSGAYSIEGRCRLDDDSQADTGFFPISDGPHSVELDWKRSSSAIANDGTFELWIDGVSQSQLTGLANSRSSVDFMRMGALNVKPTANGTLYWDEFESRRASYIGP